MTVDDDEVETSRRRSGCSLQGRTLGRRWARPRSRSRAARMTSRGRRGAGGLFERLSGWRGVADAVLREVSTAAAEVGIAPGSAEAVKLARRLSEVDLGG